MIITNPHLSGWLSVLILSATVYVLGRLFGEELSPATRRRIAWASVALLIVITVGSHVAQAAIDYDYRAYCSWAWWDFIVCW